MWERHRSFLRRGRAYGLRWHQAELTHSTLSYVWTPSRLRIECAPVSDSYRITLHESGGLAHRINGFETRSTLRQAVIHQPGQELVMDTEPFQLLLLTLDGPFVRKALIDRFGKIPETEALAPHFSMESAAGAALRTLARWMAAELDRPQRGALADPHAVAQLEGVLATLFLDCLDHPQPMLRRPVEEVAEARVARVEEWIEAHCTDSIRVDDLARIANASVRALENAFRRFRGCTPMEAVTRQRLERARRVLQSAPPGVTVTEVATASGFFHLGRFATRYREAFGESPSQTLNPPMRNETWETR